MNLILFCVFLTFSIGLFLLLAGLLRLPTLKTSRVMMDTGRKTVIQDLGCLLYGWSREDCEVHPYE